MSDVMEIAKAIQEMYMAAYKEGWHKGWDDAFDEVQKVLNTKQPTPDKLTPDEPARSSSTIV